MLGTQTTQAVNPDRLRRRTVWGALAAVFVSGIAMTVRFFFPRVVFEPPTRFRVGTAADFAPGVDERFKQSHRIWVVRDAGRLFAIYARCTHLGCTPNWMEGENKFRCPCHGSGYDVEGRNIEGPAPRPMDRARILLDADGQIVVDTSDLGQCARGGVCGAERAKDFYIPV